MDYRKKNIPMDKKILKQFLKSGFLDEGILKETEAGVPQGGSISPTIANMTLDGLTDVVKAKVEEIKKSSGRSGRKATSLWVHLIRYADDFVVTAVSKRVLEDHVIPAIQDFLKKRGLSLNIEKTKITSVKKGFDFVGFNFRIYLYKKGPGGYICLIKPTKTNLKKVKSNLKDIVKNSQNLTSFELMEQLNPVLMGWANYYNKVVSSKAYRLVGHYVWGLLWKWAKDKHLKLTSKAVVNLYFKKVANRQWIFFGKKKDREKKNIYTKLVTHKLCVID